MTTELNTKSNGSEQELILNSSKPESMGKRNKKRARGHRAVMSYPVTQGPKEVTGDRLLIKYYCLS